MAGFRKGIMGKMAGKVKKVKASSGEVGHGGFTKGVIKRVAAGEFSGGGGGGGGRGGPMARAKTAGAGKGAGKLSTLGAKVKATEPGKRGLSRRLQMKKSRFGHHNPGNTGIY